MGKLSAFPPEEYQARIDRVREKMEAQKIDVLLVSSPENIYYLCGLDHMGYFAYQALLVPIKGPLIIITREMEKATLRDQVPDLLHVGYSDGVKPLPPEQYQDDVILTSLNEEGRADGLMPWEMSLGVSIRKNMGEQLSVAASVQATCEALEMLGCREGRVGIKQNGTFLPYNLVVQLIEQTPGLTWTNASGIVDDCRITQSPLEQARTRAAARISDSMMLSAIAAAGVGVPVHDVMAALYDTMFRRGGTYPGFIPLVRSTRTIGHEHGTWQGDRLRNRDLLFIELAGCTYRYHAPMGRLVYIGEVPPRAQVMQDVAQEAHSRTAAQIGPGQKAGEIYQIWQSCIEQAGLSGYRRHHCGYSVGIGYPPSWSGSGVPVGLRANSELELRTGMVFHLMTWLLRTKRGSAFLSDTILITETGCELLTSVDREVLLRK